MISDLSANPAHENPEEAELHEEMDIDTGISLPFSAQV